MCAGDPLTVGPPPPTEYCEVTLPSPPSLQDLLNFEDLGDDVS